MKVKIAETAATSGTFEFDLDGEDGIVANRRATRGAIDDTLTFRAVSTAASGSVAATWTLYQGTQLDDGTIAYDATAAGGIILSGTTPQADSTAFVATGSRFWKLVLSGGSASSTHRIFAEVAE